MSSWDRVLTSVPINKQAAMGSARGEHWEPMFDDVHGRSDLPLPMKEYRGPPEKNLVGTVMGRITIVGYSHSTKKWGSKWVGRCTCGTYELRRRASIERNADPDHACMRCERSKVLSKRACVGHPAWRAAR